MTFTEKTFILAGTEAPVGNTPEIREALAAGTAIIREVTASGACPSSPSTVTRGAPGPSGRSRSVSLPAQCAWKWRVSIKRASPQP